MTNILCSIRGLLLLLIVVCVWLGVLTHYALTVVEVRGQPRHDPHNAGRIHNSDGEVDVAMTRLHRGGDPDSRERPIAHNSTDSGAVGEPDASASAREKFLWMQVRMLKQKLEDVRSASTSSPAGTSTTITVAPHQQQDDATEVVEKGAWRQLQMQLQRAEDELIVCRKKANDLLAQQQQARQVLPERSQGENHQQQQQGPLSSPRTPQPSAPAGLNAYEQEQWRMRQYQRGQRDDMLHERQNFIAAHDGDPRRRKRDDGGAAMPHSPFSPSPQPVPQQQQQEQVSYYYSAGGGGQVDTVPSVGLAQHMDHLVGTNAVRGPIIPVVIVAYQRAGTLKKCIDNILLRMPHVGYQLFASQDGREFPDVTQLLQRYHEQGSLIHMTHQRNASGGTQEEYAQGWDAYFAISHHYQFILQEIFSVHGYDRVILIEEDIEVGVDFFDYMAAMSPLLDRDPTLYCVSAWNDNGKAGLVLDPHAVYRSDFFPGLGWMLSKTVWKEFEAIWPKGFWDDWLRQPKQRKGRSCLRPEVPRSFTWCTEEGVSQGQFCAEHLANIKLGNTIVNWRALDTSVLVKDNYDRWLNAVVENAAELPSIDALERASGAAVDPHELERQGPGPLGMMPCKDVKIIYHTNQEFEHYAQMLTLMDDFKDDVPRTAYRGIVTFRKRNLRVHLVSAEPLYQ